MPDMIDKALEARLADRAREAWHPVSEPPTDGEDHDIVLTWCEGWTSAGLARLGMIRLIAERGDDHGLCWARQCDVVLLPPNQDT